VSRPQVLLPYRIHPVEDPSLLLGVRALRRAAYSKYLGDAAQPFEAPDAIDARPSTVVFAAQSKTDGRVVGSLRITSNADGPLPLEQSTTLPAWLATRRLAEFTRFVTEREPHDPRLAPLLMKAAFLYAESVGIEALVVASRAKMAERYALLGFEDVVPGQWVPLAHAGNLEHRILRLDLVGIRERYKALGHPMYTLAVETDHPDISLAPRGPAYARGA
jgi:hypothetical protein